jgi:hypothetical protein
MTQSESNECNSQMESKLKKLHPREECSDEIRDQSPSKKLKPSSKKSSEVNNSPGKENAPSEINLIGEGSPGPNPKEKENLINNEISKGEENNKLRTKSKSKSKSKSNSRIRLRSKSRSNVKSRSKSRAKDKDKDTVKNDEEEQNSTKVYNLRPRKNMDYTKASPEEKKNSSGGNDSDKSDSKSDVSFKVDSKFEGIQSNDESISSVEAGKELAEDGEIKLDPVFTEVIADSCGGISHPNSHVNIPQEELKEAAVEVEVQEAEEVEDPKALQDELVELQSKFKFYLTLINYLFRGGY